MKNPSFLRGGERGSLFRWDPGVHPAIIPTPTSPSTASQRLQRFQSSDSSVSLSRRQGSGGGGKFSIPNFQTASKRHIWKKKNSEGKIQRKWKKVPKLRSLPRRPWDFFRFIRCFQSVFLVVFFFIPTKEKPDPTDSVNRPLSVMMIYCGGDLAGKTINQCEERY